MSGQYKMTELGKLPECWDVDELQNLCSKNKYSIVDGPFGSNLKTIHYRDKGIPIISSGFVTNGRFIAKEYLYVDKDKFEQEKRSSVKPGDIVMAKIGARCGAAAILPPNHPTSILSGNSLKISFDNKENCTCFYLYILTAYSQDGTLNKIKTTGAQPAISLSSLKKLKFVHPPLKEQQKIAKILSTVDEKIEVIEKQIKETKVLKKGLMQRLLTKGIGHTRFKDSDLGQIPESWVVRKLNEISNVVRGGSPRPAGDPKYFNGDFLPWITVSELTNNPSIYVTQTKTSLTELGSFQTRILEPETVILANSGATLGIPKILKIKAGANDGIAAFLNLRIVNEYYLYYFLNSQTRFFREQLAPGSGQPNLNTSLIGNVSIAIPNLEEQQKIIKVLTTIDEKLEVLEVKNKNFQALKKGLMQQLLTGKMRVNV